MQSPSGQGPVWPGSDKQRLQLMQDRLQPVVDRYIEEHQLGPVFSERVGPLYLPMAEWIARQHTGKTPLFVGINGAQGSGKSTLTGLLEKILTLGFDKRVVSISIDDLYHDRATRQQMATDTHPLFITRGVPGTHDTEYGLRLFQQLKNSSGNSVHIPRFDKAIDDRLPETEWKYCELPVDIVLFEGWCVGVRPQADDALTVPVNSLEKEEDPNAVWRRAVNQHLAGDYRAWFDYIDVLIMLAVPSMEQVYEWRGLQEDRLQASTNQNDASSIMDRDGLRRFIMHYERLTRHQLKDMPSYADVYLPLDEHHQIADVIIRQPA